MYAYKMSLMSSNQVITLTPLTAYNDHLPLFSSDDVLSVNCWDVARYLKQAEIVSVGKLMKTPKGYSPVLLSKEYAGEDAEMLSNLRVWRSDLVEGMFILEKVPFDVILCALQVLFETDLGVFYDHLLDHEQARAEGLFFIEGTLNGLVNVSEKTMLVDGRNMTTAWCMLLPHDITGDELAALITKNFAAIGGLLNCEQNQYHSVFLFSKQYFPSWINNIDYRHCISHIIDEQGLDGYIVRRTHEMNRRALVVKLMELTDPSQEKLDHVKIRKLNTLLVEERGKRPDEFLSLKDNYFDDDRFDVNEPFYGSTHMLNIPPTIQVEACSKIMQLNTEDTISELIAHSSARIRHEMMSEHDPIAVE